MVKLSQHEVLTSTWGRSHRSHGSHGPKVLGNHDYGGHECDGCLFEGGTGGCSDGQIAYDNEKTWEFPVPEKVRLWEVKIGSIMNLCLKICSLWLKVEFMSLPHPWCCS